MAESDIGILVEDGMRKQVDTRRINGIIAGVLVVFFFAHAALGCLSAYVPIGHALTWLVWVGVIAVAVHVAVSIVTSMRQLGDTEHPPSARKKRHLLLKWVTGGALALVAVAHIVCVRTGEANATPTTVTGALLLAVLVAVLAIHSWVGAKSLLVDVGINKSRMTLFRAVVVGVSTLIVLGIIIGLLA